MTVKCVISFKQGATGWTETYYHSAAGIPQFIGPLANRWADGTPVGTLMSERRACLSRQCSIEHVRVTDLVTFETLPYTPVIPAVGMLYARLANQTSPGDAEVWSSLMVNLYSGTKRPRRLYLGGIPENIVTQPQFYRPDSLWQGVFANFAAVLTGGNYGWLSRPKTVPNETTLIAFTVNPDGRTALVTPRLQPNGNPTQWYVLIRGLSAPRGWNGVHRAIQTDAPNVMLIGPARRAGVSLPVFTANPKQTVSLFAPPFTAIDAVAAVKIVNKKRGRPFGLLRGRR